MNKKNPYSHIESLEELKQFACPRYQKLPEWYLKCVSCKGKCSAGERAVELLDESTASTPVKEETPVKRDPYASEKFRNGRDAWNASQKAKTRELAADVFREAALKDANPMEILSYKVGCKIETARGRINGWIREYPDLNEELHMKEIMSKYVRHYKTPVKQEPDDISIDDFLKEHPAEEKHEDAPDALRFSHHLATQIAKVESVEEKDDGLEVVAKPFVEPINALNKLTAAVRKIGGLFNPDGKTIATVGDVLDLIDEYRVAKAEICIKRERGDLTEKTAQICMLLIDDQLAKIRELEVNQ